MTSDLRAWIDSVGTDVERAVMALHDPGLPVDGYCPTCRETTGLGGGDFASLEFTADLQPAPAPCPTARVIAWNHRHEPGFRPGWAPTTEVHP